ncbi:beta-galactosidase [Capsulimonas corticalis]|uniref:beta-galactosidase n=1 Tax=Capsulimonas corticalis TaxID=2219043 RepID=A0A402D6F4_9BACT|nr:beta-galactosidase family protein [Capsulimonas corticalis]BDI32009.1 beta-galactosidase [Capsulimonas corticalis]
MKTFAISGDSFTYGGEPIQIISGALHYFRILPEHWEDRLLKLKACGLNAVETYMPWNHHQPSPDQFCFEGMLDVVRFIQMAHQLDLMVIVRPSPYICAEWEFGGLPAWLLADPGMRLRCMHPAYLVAVERYHAAVLPLLAPLQCTQGGPIIAMQIENEYGSYGNDHQYLRFLEDSIRAHGVDVLLMTSDGPTEPMLQGGTLPHVHKTANFGSHPLDAFRTLRKYQPGGPMMCMEFWNGWFDHWGAPHHTRASEDVAPDLDALLATGASVNIYMFHGGTNFGFSNGANCTPEAKGVQNYQPTVTSYDYDAPLNEAGDPTPKYEAFRNVIGKYRTLPDIPVPGPSPKAAYGAVELTHQAGLFDSLSQISDGVRRTNPETMEELGQNYGFILYRTHVAGPRPAENLVLQEVRDRAHIFVNGEFRGVFYRNDLETTIPVEIPAEGAQLDILVENMGRVNYGPLMNERKGVTEGIRLGNQFLFGWEIFCLPLEDLSSVPFTEATARALPGFFRGTLHVETLADTFLSLPGWTKGVAFINGFNLGRYWNQEPHRALYVPAPLLRAGANEVILFELEGMKQAIVEFRDSPI